jgi:hypothetical protein
LKERRAEESLYFILEVQKLRNSLDTDHLSDRCLAIFNSYVCQGAGFLINIPHRISAPMFDAFKNSRWSPTMFQAAVDEVLNLIAMNDWIPYQKSRHYRQFLEESEKERTQIENPSMPSEANSILPRRRSQSLPGVEDKLTKMSDSAFVEELLNPQFNDDSLGAKTVSGIISHEDYWRRFGDFSSSGSLDGTPKSEGRLLQNAGKHSHHVDRSKIFKSQDSTSLTTTTISTNSGASRLVEVMSKDEGDVDLSPRSTDFGSDGSVSPKGSDRQRKGRKLNIPKESVRVDSSDVKQ